MKKISYLHLVLILVWVGLFVCAQRRGLAGIESWGLAVTCGFVAVPIIYGVLKAYHLKRIEERNFSLMWQLDEYRDQMEGFRREARVSGQRLSTVRQERREEQEQLLLMKAERERARRKLDGLEAEVEFWKDEYYRRSTDEEEERGPEPIPGPAHKEEV